MYIIFNFLINRRFEIADATVSGFMGRDMEVHVQRRSLSIPINLQLQEKKNINKQIISIRVLVKVIPMF